ncbi:2-amino-4-hydroxy-6-hydroxymethyldihydropteridine diphosphokinase [Sphingobium sp. CCH11-B1]|jgi:2-amino-4-hydroxy-6-hydroxymethyldihydropteridine diphosphokinase|uniref:2-amino-4-hydroxy-6- hydroxymethyldihydropteridine diphosphokinase n=1 Tax=Sphingobium sp. CCH11-B1 TaxID=1768781 RepID=UPI00082FE2CE|nr:2-amino-4-hydroxy-6-hydroxymethyldihydropteridine diphosphokinase [Sphingobium sp. CCH11-B1]MEA3387940.1 2-amino-4-hydroxy-6-hydroxymethyldihydropteridine diphosphokinase [Pseudomonadota bacterium]
MALHDYALALGSNRPLSARRAPARLLSEAARLIAETMRVVALSPTILTPPLGPSSRLFANAALLVQSRLTPPEMLAFLQGIEMRLGRRRHRRWGARSMDIDIILWSGGAWRSRTLIIPHAAWRDRAFVLTPLAAIGPGLRDPLSGLTVRQLHARLQKAKAKVDHRPRRH